MNEPKTKDQTTMSKKDFIALADVIIRSAPADRSAYGIFNRSAILALADFCASQNPMFKRDRWLDYIAGKCGKNGGAIKNAA